MRVQTYKAHRARIRFYLKINLILLLPIKSLICLNGNIIEYVHLIDYLVRCIIIYNPYVLLYNNAAITIRILPLGKGYMVDYQTKK